MLELVGDLERALAALYPNRVPIAIGLAIAAGLFVWWAWRRGWHLVARRHPRRTVAALVVAIAVLGPIGWYLGSPLFIRVEAGGGSLTPGTAVLSGAFRGADEFHSGSGTARIVAAGSGHVLQFESFSVRNGPDLYVYLSTSPDGYVPGATELGTLKATDGAFEYELPAGMDATAIRSVVVWCKAFSVQFAHAPLSPAG